MMLLPTNTQDALAAVSATCRSTVGFMLSSARAVLRIVAKKLKKLLHRRQHESAQKTNVKLNYRSHTRRISLSYLSTKNGKINHAHSNTCAVSHLRYPQISLTPCV